MGRNDMVAGSHSYQEQGLIAEEPTRTTERSVPQPNWGEILPEYNDLVKKLAPAIWRYLAAMGVRESDVPDVCQQVFISAHRNWRNYRGESTRRAWLYGIARNAASDHRKLRGRQERAYHQYGEVAEVLTHPSLGPETHAQASRSLRLLDQLLAELDEGVRNVFVLYEIEGLGMSEIVAREQIPLQTGYSRLHAGRKAVRQGFAAKEDET